MRNGGAAKNKGKYVNDEKKLHPMLIATWSLNGKSVTVKESKERKSKKGYAGYREEEKIVFQEVLYASKFVRFGEFSEDSKSKCKTAHPSLMAHDGSRPSRCRRPRRHPRRRRPRRRPRHRPRRRRPRRRPSPRRPRRRQAPHVR